MTLSYAGTAILLQDFVLPYEAAAILHPFLLFNSPAI
jgi:hypothetical protein